MIKSGMNEYIIYDKKDSNQTRAVIVGITNKVSSICCSFTCCLIEKDNYIFLEQKLSLNVAKEQHPGFQRGPPP